MGPSPTPNLAQPFLDSSKNPGPQSDPIPPGVELGPYHEGMKGQSDQNSSDTHTHTHILYIYMIYMIYIYMFLSFSIFFWVATI